MSDERERPVVDKERLDVPSFDHQVLRSSVPTVRPAVTVEPMKSTKAVAATSNLVLSLAFVASRALASASAVHVVLAAMVFASHLLTMNPGQNVQQPQVPGPSAALFASQQYYSCTSNRYASPTGLSTNTGTSPASPWDIVTAAAFAAPAGTCINFAVGNYTTAITNNSGVSVSNGGTSSTKTGYVVWRCAVLSTVFVNGLISGEGNGCVFGNTTGGSVLGIQANTSFIMFDGFEINCGVANANGGVAIDAETGGNTGIGVPNNTATYHHIWALNNDLHGCGGGGIQWNATDWLFVIHNVWHDDATTNGAFESGLSFFQPAGLTGYTPTPGNPDYWHSNTTGRTYNMVIAYNAGYRNYNTGVNTTDGEGIIFDTPAWSGACSVGTSGATCPYAGNVLIMGNAMWGNGGNGIEVFSYNSGNANPNSTAHVDIINNTTYSNAWDPNNTGTFGAGLLANLAQNTTVFNNIAITVTGSRTCVNTGFSCSVLDQNEIGTELWQTNLAFPASPSNVAFANGATYPTVGLNHNLDGSDPKLKTLNPITSTSGSGAENFSLQPSSPAIGFGQAFDLWQQSGTVDAGACPFNAPGPVTNCP